MRGRLGAGCWTPGSRVGGRLVGRAGGARLVGPWAVRSGWAVAAESVQRQDRADAAADRLSARHAVGAGGAFLEPQDLGRHRGGELLAPPCPRQWLVVEQQRRPRGVALNAAGLDLGLDVQDHSLVAEADAEVLQASVPAAGRRQHVVELVVEHGGGVTGRRPQTRLAAPGSMVVVEHPPADDRVAQRYGPCRDGVVLEVVLLTVDPSQGLRVGAVVFAHEHLDLRREAQEAAVEVAGDPMPSGVCDALRRLRGVVPLVLAEQHNLGAVILAAEKPRLLRVAQRPPVVDAAVRPPLGLESPAPVAGRV